ncbi:amino acid ABC transporter permease [Actinomyces polynesiensis]|uniref:amino acid ABC transporter permease n=1 Tax=Actinomyces polynesiensis TaxID=1325934 RepID=UPI0005BA35F7|nr:amino acid ABC transporter permease [Actinomyces polynesiensis]
MDVLFNNLDLFVDGFRNTLILFAGGGAIALVLGFITGAMRVSPVPVMRAVGTLYVNLVRNTPLTLLFFFFVLGYPKLFPKGTWGSGLSFVQLAIIALGLYTATYIAEVIRSGINTIPAGQMEAGRALGFTFTQSMELIVLPQAGRAVIPPLMSVLIALLKNTTVAAGFSVAEAGAIRASLSERSEPLLAGLLWVAAIFVVLVLLLATLQRYLENRLKVVR